MSEGKRLGSMNLYTWILIFVYAAVALTEEVGNDFRLPKTLVPFHYKLKILTKLTDDFSYSGKVWIDLEAFSDVQKIVLNSKNLKIYENETTVEELNLSAISNTLKSNFPKKKIKRNAILNNPSKLEEQTYSVLSSVHGVVAEELGALPKVVTDAPGIHVTNFESISGHQKDQVTSSPAAEVPTRRIAVPNLQKVHIITGDDNVRKSGWEQSTRETVTESHMPGEISGKDGPQGSSVRGGMDMAATVQLPNQEPVQSTMGMAPSTVGMTEPTKDAPFAESSMMTPTPPSPSMISTTAESAPAKITPVTERSPKPATITLPNFTGLNEEMISSSNPSVHQSTDEPFTVNIKPQSHQYEKGNHFVIINLNTPLRTGRKYRLQLRFRGVLSDSLSGYYRVSYNKKNSKKVSWLASTVFEPNDARSAFPCFDEPQYKATFDIALAHDKKYTALSNMPVKSVSAVDGRSNYQWTTFERTPKMSTYLVAFVISDLQNMTAKSNDSGNTTYRFWARPEVLHRTRYAAKIVPQMKNYLESILGVTDVMPKYDFVALPSFISNALENWGLVSFAERNILFTPGFTSAFSKFETTQMLGHEVSHTWFGNLVTPKYWDQIWLSEGFSNFFEVAASNHVQPSWEVSTVALVFSYLKVFSVDAMHSSHPLVPKIKSLNDMNEIFDSVTYQKGYYLVRMLNHILGEETFMKGVHDYLEANKYSNVDENDLWNAMTVHAHADGSIPEDCHLKNIMYNWTRRTGYPVIDVIRDYDNNTAVVTQRRFLRPKLDLELRKAIFTDDEPEDTKWWIPLTYTTGRELDFKNTKPKLWIKPQDDETILMDMPDNDDFVLMNLEASGLYRVNYDNRNWALIIDALLSEQYENISVINRVQIIDDLLDFARAGQISYPTAFQASTYLKQEKHFLPWKAALSNFEYISRMFRSTESNRLFKRYIRNLVGQRFDELGLEPKKNETMLDAMNRRQIVKWACSTGHRQCIRKSLGLYKKWTKERKPDENNPIPSNIRSIVYCAATAHGGPKDWQFLWNRYLNNVEVSDKLAIINGLGCTKNTKTLRKYLDRALSETSGIRKQDTVAVFKSVAKNEAGFNIAKDFLRNRMGEVKRYLGNSPYYITQMVESIASKMNQESHLMELEELEEKHFAKLRSVPRTFKQAKERVTFNIDWLDQNYDQITDWLKKQEF